MRFEVPQFIEVEDKIFGPFTFKQFVYLIGGLGAGGVVYLLTRSIIVFVIFGAPFIALGGFLAFHKINNRPFSYFLESFVHYITGTKLYLWKKEREQTIVEKSPAPDPLDAYGLPPVKATPEAPKGNIASLSRKLELNSLEGGPQ